MLSKEEVKHIAKLARLELTEEEIVKFQKELSVILDYVGKLKKANVLSLPPTSHSFKTENVTREDEIKKTGEKRNVKLLELMPENKNGYLKVKSILQ